MSQFYIGIDPNYSEKGRRLIGVAVGRPGEGLETVETMELTALLDIFEAAPADTLVRIETPSVAVHGAAEAALALFTKSRGGFNAKIGSVGRVMSKRGAAVGRLREQSKMIADLARRHGFAVEEIPETARRRCDKKPRSMLSAQQLREATSSRLYLSKLDAARFKKLTGWNKRTNDDGRDAALLIYFEL